MATQIDDVSIEGMRLTHFEQLRSYINDAEERGEYYGNKKQFDARHRDLKQWVESICSILEGEGVKVGKPKRMSDANAAVYHGDIDGDFDY